MEYQFRCDQEDHLENQTAYFQTQLKGAFLCCDLQISVTHFLKNSP